MWSLRRPGTLPGAAELEAVTAAGDHPAERWWRTIGHGAGRAPYSSLPRCRIRWPSRLPGPPRAPALAWLHRPRTADLRGRRYCHGRGGRRGPGAAVSVCLVGDGEVAGRKAATKLHVARRAERLALLAADARQDGETVRKRLRDARTALEASAAQWSSSSAIRLRSHTFGRAAFPHPAPSGGIPPHARRRHGRGRQRKARGQSVELRSTTRVGSFGCAVAGGARRPALSDRGANRRRVSLTGTWRQRLARRWRRRRSGRPFAVFHPPASIVSVVLTAR